MHAHWQLIFTGAKVLARQAAEQLYACQQEAERDECTHIPYSHTRQDQQHPSPRFEDSLYLLCWSCLITSQIPMSCLLADGRIDALLFAVVSDNDCCIWIALLLLQGWACRPAKAQSAAEAECRHRLSVVQSHMFELSQEVSLVELALELAEARYNILPTASGKMNLVHRPKVAGTTGMSHLLHK